VVIEDDGMTEDEFRTEMLSLNKEFEKLSEEAKTLEQEIENNLKELFGKE
jgi:putative type I restriction-modification system, M subunit